MSFLEKVDLLMSEHGLNKRQLSQASGIPYMTISDWYKKGFENTRISTIKKLAKFFNVTIDYLLDGEPTPTPLSQKSPAASRLDTAEEIAEKYSKLDTHGKRVVCVVLNEECQRIEQEERPIITAAARNGERLQVQQPTPEEEEAALPPPYKGNI